LRSAVSGPSAAADGAGGHCRDQEFKQPVPGERGVHVAEPGGRPSAMTVQTFDANVLEMAPRLRAFLRRRGARRRDRGRSDAGHAAKGLPFAGGVAGGYASCRPGSTACRGPTLIDYYRRQKTDGGTPRGDRGGEPERAWQAMRTAIAASRQRFLEELPEPIGSRCAWPEVEGLPLAKIALRMDPVLVDAR